MNPWYLRPIGVTWRALLLAVVLTIVVGLNREGQPSEGAIQASDEPRTQQAAAEGVRARECRWATGKIKIDGVADEKAWEQAEVIADFGADWLTPAQPARSSTRARLLWDREALYFFAEMEDQDLYADVVEHDGMCWLNDVFELFFKPADDRLAYYEFQVNAANTSLDMLLPSRGSGGYERWKGAQPFHVESAVRLDGTLNAWQDTDQGWSVEGRIPWADFQATGQRPAAADTWRFALCRYDYSVHFETPDLSCCASLTKPDFHHYEDYALLQFVGPGK